MPERVDHCYISKECSADHNTFQDLHRWIDLPSKESGKNHRSERHAYIEKDRAEIERIWHEKGVLEWLMHIAIDNLDSAIQYAENHGLRFDVELKYNGRDVFDLLKKIRMNPDRGKILDEYIYGADDIDLDEDDDWLDEDDEDDDDYT